jgi:hypothetical protein
VTILTQADLLRLTGLTQKAALRRHLRKQGIPFREPGGRITTTEEAFTAILVGRAKNKKAEPNWAALDGD